MESPGIEFLQGDVKFQITPTAESYYSIIALVCDDGTQTSAGINSAWMRRHLSDSIYIWACGEKVDEEDEDPGLSDRLIGWLILMMQGFAYAMLIVLAKETPDPETDSSADGNVESSYLLPSVTGAMYLLVASTTHDLRAGFLLLVDGTCAGHRAFGIGLLIVYGIMITAAMTVLVSTSADSASVVLNAVTVLFIADLDEKVLKFLAAVPQRWRSFWAIQSIGISFALALIAILYIGESSPLLEGNTGILKSSPMWFIWLVNPVAVTVASVLVSSTLQACFDCWRDSHESEDDPTIGLTVKSVLARTVAIVRRAAECFWTQPVYYVIKVLWFAQMVPNYLYIKGGRGFPKAFALVEHNVAGTDDRRLVMTDNKLVMVAINVVLATGVALKALTVCLARRERVAAIEEPRRSSENNTHGGGWHSYTDSRVPSLLVGWGTGYWASSLLAVLVCAWYGDECQWHSAPIIATAISYVIFPCVVFAGIFMVADPDILGEKFAGFFKPAVDILRNRARVEYWVLSTVYRDFFVLWLSYCNFLRKKLENQL